MRLGIGHLRSALGVCLAAVLLAACGSSSSSSTVTSASAASSSGASASTTTQASSSGPSSGSYGDCKVTGSEGKFKLQTVNPDTLTVGTLLPLPGYFNGASPDEVHSGYEYCLAAEIAWRAGLKLGLQSISFDKVVAGSFPNTDAVIASVSITPQREKVLDFSQPYNHTTSGILVRKAKLLDQNTVKTAKIGLLIGSVQESLVKQLGATPVFFQSPVDLFTALTAGQIDAATGDTYSMLEEEKASHGTLKVVGQYNIGGANGVAFKKGSPNVAMVNNILADIGPARIEQLKQQYLFPLLGRSPDTIPTWTQ